MSETAAMRIIAHIHTDFTEKFGIPRQSGLVKELSAQIIFEPEYRIEAAFRGLEGYSHIWILWQFSKALREDWSPTVRPPRLGGKTRMGVFATRSPYRPNPIGLSCVELEKIEFDPELGPILHVRGADLLDGTPIYDIKPYLSYVDAHPQAKDGFALAQKEGTLAVDFPANLLAQIPQNLHEGLIAVLSQDPRPGYQHEPERVYKMAFGGFDIHFTIENETASVINILKLK